MIPNPTNKISAHFATILHQMKPTSKVRAIVILDLFPPELMEGRKTDRVGTIAALRQSAEPALVTIDDILDRFDGERLADNPDALGSIHVEATPAGIEALASSNYVRAILEDQPISLP